MDNSLPIKLSRLVGVCLLLLFLTQLLTACNPTADHRTESEKNWSVTLEISGGFAGIMQTLTLDHTGQAVWVDKKRKTRVEKQLSEQDLRTYAELIKALPVATDTKSEAGSCRDCINYGLRINQAGTLKRRQLDSISLSDSDAKGLILQLNKLASELKTHK
jgi:hypothetical protein